MELGMSKVVEVVMNDDEEMFFYGGREIEKPKKLAVKVGEYTAYSSTGADGRERFFRADQVASVQGMETQN